MPIRRKSAEAEALNLV